LKIRNISIKNFLSIGDVSYTFTDGIQELIGINEDIIVDGKTSSNGSGKSAFTLAILQCLYNKNPKVTLTDSCSNNVSNSPYDITLNVESNGIDYIIRNNRAKLQLVVTDTTNDKVVSTRIKDSLPIIEKIVGMTYSEFIGLMYVNSQTISDTFSQDSNFILKYFDLTVLDRYMKNLKEERRELNSTLKGLNLRVSDINKRSLAIDEASIQKKITKLEEEKIELMEQHEFITEGGICIEALEDLTHKVNNNKQIKQDITSKLQLSDLGICPTCNQSVDASDKDMLETQLKKINITEVSLSGEHKMLTNTYDSMKKDFDSKLRKLDIEIAQEQSKLVTRKHIEKTSNDDVNALQKEVIGIERKLLVIKTVIATLDAGKVTTAHLHTFLIGMNTELQTLLNDIGLDIEVTASVKKASIKFRIEQDNIVKTVDMLSGGEETILALVILTALYKTLEKQMGVVVPLLFLDEAFNRIDRSNIKRVVSILDILKQDRTVIIVQHHKELPSEVFDDTITLTKLNGITTRKD